MPPLAAAFDGGMRKDNRAEVGYSVVSPGELRGKGGDPDPGERVGQAGELGTPPAASGTTSEPVEVPAALPSFDASSELHDAEGSSLAVEAGTVVPDAEGSTLLHVPRKPVFAVVAVGSHQFKVTPGDIVYTEKLTFAKVNERLRLDRVLLLGSTSETVVGRPTVPGAHVLALVEEQMLDAKVIVFKKKRRKNYRRQNDHRQQLTRLRILDVAGIKP